MKIPAAVKNIGEHWLLEEYCDQYSNGLNQECLICWALFMSFCHVLYFQLSLTGALLVMLGVVLLKFIKPTDFDKQRWGIESSESVS